MAATDRTSGPARAPTPGNRPTPDRQRFALSGPSRPLDLGTNAARRDLADIRLAGRWFAPHYAEPEMWQGVQDGLDLHAAPSELSEAVSQLGAGEAFAVLEISGDWAWGYRIADNLVGYVRASGLSPTR